MTDLPEPLTPADCDLRGLPYMPLDVNRLLDSDMFAESSGDELKAAIALWCKSWTQIPAGSLPNKEKVLEELSRSKNWKRVKAGAMRGWILCSDNRWYHPVVAEKALAALPGREEFNSKKSADAERKAREREDRKALFETLKTHDIVPEWNVSTKVLRQMVTQIQSQDNCDQSRDMSQQVTVSKGEVRERKEEGIVNLEEQPPSDDSTDSGSAIARKSEGGPPREATLPTREKSPLSEDPAVQLTVALRRQGVNVMSTNPHLLQWVADGVTLEQLTEAVAVARESKGDTAKIVPGYLVPILDKIRNPPAAATPTIGKPRVDDWGWRKSNQGIEAKGRELGMLARAGESYPDFTARIQTEIDKRKGGTP